MWKSSFPIFCLITAGCYSVNSASTFRGSSIVDGLLRTAGSVVDDDVGVGEQLADDTLPKQENKQKTRPTETKDNESDKTVVFLEDSPIKVVDTPVDSGSGRARQVRRSTIAETVKQIIVKQLGVNPKEVVPSASFIDDLGADSLGLVELIMAFEEEFQIDIPDEEAEKLTTVQLAIDYIRKNLIASRR